MMRAQRPGLFLLGSGRITFDLRLNENGQWKKEGGGACGTVRAVQGSLGA